MKFIVEHMESTLSPWVQIEYNHMTEIVGPNNLYITCLDKEAMQAIPDSLKQKAICTGSSVLDKELGFDKDKIILLDPSSKEPLTPQDADKYDYLLFGGILGDHPPKDRTGELRKLGFATRHLGLVQLPTDHAVLFAHKIAHEKIELEHVPYIDNPEIKLSKHETVSIPMRYYRGDNGQAVLAPGMKKHLKESQNDILI